MIRTHRRFILGLCAGIVVGVFVAGIGFFALENFWPAYAMAKITASYDLTMYCARLCLGVCGVTSSGYIATLVANDRGHTAWWLGGLLFSISLPIHIYEWAKYPVWYHLIYLSYLIPLTGLTGMGLAGAMVFGVAPMVQAGCVLQKLAELPVTMRAGCALLSVKINGQDNLMAKDSGAFYSVLDTAKAKELHLPPSSCRRASTLSGRVIMSNSAMLGLMSARSLLAPRLRSRS